MGSQLWHVHQPCSGEKNLEIGTISTAAKNYFRNIDPQHWCSGIWIIVETYHQGLVLLHPTFLKV
jgi:hypothetical protein